MISVASVSTAESMFGVVHGTWSTVRLVPIADASEVSPVDVALVDGYAATRTSVDVAGVLARSGRARVVVVHALHITPDLVEAARREKLTALIGRQVFGPALVDTLVDIASTDGRGIPIVVKNHDHALSEREREVLLLIGDGQTNDEIAAELTVSVNTVKSCARGLYRKLGVRNRTGAAMVAHRHQHASIERPLAIAAD